MNRKVLDASIKYELDFYSIEICKVYLPAYALPALGTYPKCAWHDDYKELHMHLDIDYAIRNGASVTAYLAVHGVRSYCDGEGGFVTHIILDDIPVEISDTPYEPTADLVV